MPAAHIAHDALAERDAGPRPVPRPDQPLFTLGNLTTGESPGRSILGAALHSAHAESFEPGHGPGSYHGYVVSGRRNREARPGRQAVVAASLADLHGPVSGAVELPLRLFWSLPGHRFDLADRDMRLWLYQTVLREASRPDELSDYLDGALLIRLWPELYLPKGVRHAWEDQHPQLRDAAAA